MRRLILLLFFFVFVGNLNAQVKVRPGIKTGLNFSNITNSDLVYKAGLNASAFVHIRFSDVYTLQPELGYSSQGGKLANGNNDDFAIDYFTIGFANKLFFSDTMRLHFTAGPSFDFNFGNGSIWDSFESDFSLLDISIFVGLGYEFDFGLMVETRYKHGIINVDLFGTDFENYELGKNNLNSVFQLALAYKFDW